MTIRAFIVAMAVCGLVFSGCAKKPKQVQQNVPAPSLPEPAAAPAVPKTDTGDVFNEYYKDAKGNKVDRTFSMNASSGAESYTPEFSENGRWVVQIAAGPSSAGADELANAFKSKGYPAYVAEVENPTPELSGTYYRVRIGGFHMLADAKAFGENILRPANYDYWVDLRSNDAVGTGTASATGYSSGGSTYSTPSYTPASSEPSYYTPATPAATTDYGAASSGTTPSTSTGTSTYDWSAPSTTPAETAPASSSDTGTGSWDGSSWK